MMRPQQLFLNPGGTLKRLITLYFEFQQSTKINLESGLVDSGKLCVATSLMAKCEIIKLTIKHRCRIAEMVFSFGCIARNIH